MASDSRMTDPQPGIDYYVEEGRYVFTAVYLAKRGWCCGNGCRHCPYDGKRNRDEVESREATAVRES